MSNPFSEDALIEQPAIRLFKDGLGWQAVNAYDETVLSNLRQTGDLLLPRLVSGKVEV